MAERTASPFQLHTYNWIVLATKRFCLSTTPIVTTKIYEHGHNRTIESQKRVRMKMHFVSILRCNICETAEILRTAPHSSQSPATMRREENVCSAMMSWDRTNKVNTHNFIGVARRSVRLSVDVSYYTLHCWHVSRYHFVTSILAECASHKASPLSVSFHVHAPYHLHCFSSILPRYALNTVAVTPSENLLVGCAAACCCHCRLWDILFWHSIFDFTHFPHHKSIDLAVLACVRYAFIPLNRRIE